MKNPGFSPVSMARPEREERDNLIREYAAKMTLAAISERTGAWELKVFVEAALAAAKELVNFDQQDSG